MNYSMTNCSFFKALQHYHAEKPNQAKRDNGQQIAERKWPSWQEIVLFSMGNYLVQVGQKMQMRYQADVAAPIQRAG